VLINDPQGKGEGWGSRLRLSKMLQAGRMRCGLPLPPPPRELGVRGSLGTVGRGGGSAAGVKGVLGGILVNPLAKGFTIPHNWDSDWIAIGGGGGGGKSVP